ncbi:MAG: two-component sensor histidine kinase, partial [Caryophanon sp.]|nr:two-component sensor histidine kinase [Caryophanon sp.]
MKQRSLKEKWTAVTSLVIFVSYALMCTVVYIALHTWLSNEEEREARRTMDDLVAMFETQQGRLT